MRLQRMLVQALGKYACRGLSVPKIRSLTQEGCLPFYRWWGGLCTHIIAKLPPWTCINGLLLLMSAAESWRPSHRSPRVLIWPPGSFVDPSYLPHSLTSGGCTALPIWPVCPACRVAQHVGCCVRARPAWPRLWPRGSGEAEMPAPRVRLLQHGSQGSGGTESPPPVGYL